MAVVGALSCMAASAPASAQEEPVDALSEYLDAPESSISSGGESRWLEGGTSPSGFASLTSSHAGLSYYSGSAFLWTEDFIDWGYNHSAVTYTDTDQAHGFIFPNTARNDGVTKSSRSNSGTVYHSYTNTIGAGIVTPWGDAHIYSMETTNHNSYVRSNGAGCIGQNCW